MPAWTDPAPGRLAELAGAVLLTVLPALATDPSRPDPPARVVTTLADERIAESSGLVAARGRLLLTVNDSGDGPVVYAVDAGTGETVGVTSYPGEAVDVEALAPGPDGSVWVGDLGDNHRARSSVDVYRLPAVAPGDRTVPAERYTLTYPGRPRDAEALLVHPRTGRVFVVTKELVTGGTVYRAPADLDPGTLHRLTPVAQAPRLVTDGTFLPDGRHVLLRGYGTASVYTFPGFEPVGSFALPEQEQGEAVAVRPGGRLLLTSEGVGSEVLEVVLPADLRAALRPAVPEPAAPVPTGNQTGPAPAGAGNGAGPAGWAVVAVASAGVAGLLLRGARRRSRRRR